MNNEQINEKKTVAKGKKEVKEKKKRENKILTLTPKREKELLKAANGPEGEKKRKAIRALIFYNQNLVKYISRGCSPVGKDIDTQELASEGNLSLLKAIKNFNLNSKNRFATYAGYWIRQFIQSFKHKSQLINQGTTKERKNLVYYDNYSFQSNDDRENKSYSLMDTLDDSEGDKISGEQVRQEEISRQMNDLINGLKDREKILVTRLWGHDKKHSKVVPKNLFDVFCMATEEEKLALEKSEKKQGEELKDLMLFEKKTSSLPVVKKYLALFDKSYKFNEVAKIIGKPEVQVKKIKLESLKDLQKLAEERKLNNLAD